jgi:hypothetical protein
MPEMPEDLLTEKNSLGIIPPRPGHQPVTDMDAFLAWLPDLEPEEAEAFDRAIAENRAQRRAASEPPE